MQREVDRDDTAPARSDGAPTDPVTSDERPAESGHGPIAQLLIPWSPLSVILLPYALAGWISAPLGTGDGADTNRLGFVVNVPAPPLRAGRRRSPRSVLRLLRRRAGR